MNAFNKPQVQGASTQTDQRPPLISIFGANSAAVPSFLNPKKTQASSLQPAGSLGYQSTYNTQSARMPQVQGAGTQQLRLVNPTYKPTSSLQVTQPTYRGLTVR